MESKKWKSLIMRNCKSVGTMQPAFKSVIETLADILEQRDKVWEQFVSEGAQVIIERVSDRGAVNSAKNPLFVTWMDLNTQALSYWRDLGLTPKGLKAINDLMVKDAKKDPLVEALRKISGDGDGKVL